MLSGVIGCLCVALLTLHHLSLSVGLEAIKYIIIILMVILKYILNILNFTYFPDKA